MVTQCSLSLLIVVQVARGYTMLMLTLAVVGKSIMQIDNRWIDAHRITI